VVALLDSVTVANSVDRSVAERAAELRVTKPFRKMPDALILATAELQQADLVITGDHRWLDTDAGPRVELLAPARD
jgi:predicted nucleic acid-binding protein